MEALGIGKPPSLERKSCNRLGGSTPLASARIQSRGYNQGMRIVAISDTHLRHERSLYPIPECDLLIHAGDACLEGDLSEVNRFAKWLGEQPAKHKVFVPGNHDWLFEKDENLARSLLPAGTIYLRDNVAVVEGLKIYGAPWQPEFCSWAFNLPRGAALREKWAKIPDGIDILVTHGPPYGIRDYSHFGNEHVGCVDLLDAVRRVKPRVHVFGHVHGDYGWTRKDGILYVNCAVCDEAYKPTHDPAVLEISAGICEVLSGPPERK